MANQTDTSSNNNGVNYSQPIAGLNLSNVIDQIKQNYLLDAQNAVVENFDGHSVAYQNEQANEVVVSNVPEGLVILHAKNVLPLNSTYLWLVKEDNSYSEIGYINHLENSYKPLIQDSETDKMNFNLDYPIHKVVHKMTNCSVQFYWTDSYNHRRYLDLDNLPWKSTFDPNEPSVEIPIEGDLDVNKLLVQPNFKIPYIDDIEIDEDGGIKEGAYQFAIQYANSRGETYSSVFSVTNPISIVDNRIATQDFMLPTTKSIRFKVKNLDTTGLYDYFNIIVIETVNNISTPKILGTFPVTIEDRVYTYTGYTETNENISMKEVMEEFPYYDIAKDLTTSGDSLIWADLKQEEAVNYQEIWSKVKCYWVTYKIPYNNFEGYLNPLNTQKYRGYLRDEIYPFHGTFYLTNGKKTAAGTLINRSPTQHDLEILPKTNIDSITYDEDNPCEESTSQPRWKIYNTGSKIGFTQEYLDYINKGGDESCYVGPYEYGEFAYWESDAHYPNNKDIWGDLANKPIRHFKFPDSTITHHYDQNPSEDRDYVHSIFPLGVMIDEGSLKNAIDQSSLTDFQKRRIAGFKISRGNRAQGGNKSVIAKGLFNNVGISNYDGKKQYYANYPYNDLRPDPFYTKRKIKSHIGFLPSLSLKGFETEESKERFIFYSPETSFTNPQITSGYIKIDSIEYGTSFSNFDKVEANAEYKFLSREIVRLCTGIGVASSMTLAAGTFGWPTFSIERIIPGFLDSQRMFENLAPFTNFGLKANSVGIYNKHFIIPNEEGNKIRNINFIRYVTDGRNAIENGNSLNHFRRESAVYINTQNSLLFPHEYSTTIPKDESRYILSQTRNNASPTEDFNLFLTNYSSFSITDGEIKEFYQVVDVFADKIKMAEFEIFASGTVAPDTSCIYTYATNITQTIYYLQIVEIRPNGTTSTGETIYVGKVLITNWDESFESVAPGMAAAWVIQSHEMNTAPPSPVICNLLLVEHIDINNIDYDEVRQDLDDFFNTLSGPDYVESFFNADEDIYSEQIELLQFVFNNRMPTDYEDILLKREEKRSISSYYGAIKKYNALQWGEINSYEKLDTGDYFTYNTIDKTFNKKLHIFGGDTFINRFALKTKHQFFYNTTVGEKYEDQSGIQYDQLGVLNYPMFWLSTSPEKWELPGINDIVRKIFKLMDNSPNLSDKEGFSWGKVWRVIVGIFSGGGANVGPFLKLLVKILNAIYKSIAKKNINFDNQHVKAFLERGYMYLYNYGIPYFFVESTINIDQRKAFNEKEQNFYPRVSSGIPEDWFQEINVPIIYDNYFNYNKSFSKQHHETFFHVLRWDWNPNKTCMYYFQNRAIYSDLTSMEETKNNWLVYRPMSYFDFPKSFGTITAVDGLENRQVLLRFTEHTQIYNALTTMDTSNPLKVYLGNDRVFSSSPPIDLRITNSGYAGSQHKFLLSTEYGHITIDSKRGQILLLSGTNYKELTELHVDKWFNQHLPFKILEDFPSVNIDNHFKDIGLHGVYDYYYKRALITKRDYKLRDEYKNKIVYFEGDFYLLNSGEGSSNDNQDPYSSSSNSNTTPKTKILCNSGYIYNPISKLCEKTISNPIVCDEGFTFNSVTNTCDPIEGGLESCEIDLIIIYPKASYFGGSVQADSEAFLSDLITDLTPNITSGKIKVGVVVEDAHVLHSSPLSFSIPVINNALATPKGTYTYANIAPGLCEALSIFSGSTARPTAQKKIIVVATDYNKSNYKHCLETSDYPDTTGNAQVYRLGQKLKTDFEAEITVVGFGDTNTKNMIRGYYSSDWAFGSSYIPGATPTPPNNFPLSSSNQHFYLYPFDNTVINNNTNSLQNLQEVVDCLNLVPYTPTCEGSIINGYCTLKETHEPIVVIDDDFSNNGDGDNNAENSIEEEIAKHGQKVSLDDLTYFKNCSWTLSFSFILNNWASFHSYVPNVYIEFPNFFQSSKRKTINYSNQTIWDHNKTYTLFNNFYGEIKPYYIKHPYAFSLQDELITSVIEMTKAIKYIDSHNWHEPDEQIFFNKSIVSNSRQSTGVLNLIPKNKSNLSQYFFNPIINNDSIDIQITRKNSLYYYNSLWDIVKSNNTAIFVESDFYPDFREKLNTTNIFYDQSSYKKARIRSKDASIIHILDNRDDVKLITKIQITPTTKFT